MTDLKNYYVLQVATNEGEYKYLGTLYTNSINKYDSIDDAIKFPEKETPKLLGEYICWRENANFYRVFEIKTTMEEVEYE